VTGMGPSKWSAWVVPRGGISRAAWRRKWRSGSGCGRWREAGEVFVEVAVGGGVGGRLELAVDDLAFEVDEDHVGRAEVGVGNAAGFDGEDAATGSRTLTLPKVRSTSLVAGGCGWPPSSRYGCFGIFSRGKRKRGRREESTDYTDFLRGECLRWGW